MIIAIPRAKIYFPLRIWRRLIGSNLSRKLWQDKDISLFERNFAEYIGVRYATSVSCGKMGLYLSLQALGAQAGDEIILPSYTIKEVPAVIVSLRLKPVFVDIDQTTYNIDTDLIENRITSRTRFILATHLYGLPCRIDSILEIARKHNLKIIEDCAQACGAEYNHKKVGSFGDVSYFSFGILKNLNTLGGGMVATNNRQVAERIKSEVEHFALPQRFLLIKQLFLTTVLSLFISPVIFTLFVFPFLYFMRKLFNNITKLFLKTEITPITDNFCNKYKVKFSNLQAIIGLEQLKIIDAENNKRAKNAQILNYLLKDNNMISIPKVISYAKNIYLNYVIQVPEEKRDEIMRRLLKRGIDIWHGELDSCANLKEFQEFKVSCPLSDRLVKSNLYVPIFSPLEEKQMNYIARSLEDVLK